MRFLFWNTHKNSNINSVLCDLITENKISIIILAEYTANINELINQLSLRGILMESYPTPGCDRIHIVGKKGLNIEPEQQNHYTSIQVLDDDIILCCVHLSSQIYSDNDEKREIQIVQIINDVLAAEKKYNTTKTMIVGDFNINPYDQSCISARYFHGIPIYEESQRISRIIAETEFYMFYNPMWNFLGDFKEPYGTYYYNSGNTINTYWNVYDQVILRPVLRSRFVDDSLKILTETEVLSLLDKKKHPNHDISDHLPIVFEIKEETYE